LGLEAAASGLSSGTLQILLENTAGAGASIGSRFEELAAIREEAQARLNMGVGYCVDTAHCLESGLYDVSSAAGFKTTVQAMESVLGMDYVKVIHANDSKTPFGSHLDRHQHIGQGYIGKEGFRRILTHPKLREKAFILETPVDDDGDERSNLDTLKKLCRKSSTTTTKSK
ncbi:MAG: deoxyribonuclease IV, partial [Bryobacteraceae bacterium]